MICDELPGVRFPAIGRMQKQEAEPSQVLANRCMAHILPDALTESHNDIHSHQMVSEGVSVLAMMLITCVLASAKKR